MMRGVEKLYYDNFYQFNDSNQQLGYLPRQQQGFPAANSMPNPQMGQGQGPAPFLAPPSFTPPMPAWQVGPSGIRRCMNRNTFIWLTNGNNLWFFPTFVGRQSLVGFRWRGFGWIYSVIELRNIRSFQCF